MSKPLFRLHLTAAHTRLLVQLLNRTTVSADSAADLGSLYGQVQSAKKYYGLTDEPAPPPPPNAT